MQVEAILVAAEPWTREERLTSWGLIFTGLAFVVAIVQLWRTASNTSKSVHLLKNVQERLIGNDLLILLPELHRLEDDLESYVKAKEPLQVERTLVAFSRISRQVAAVLEETENVDATELIPLLRAASRLATNAKADVAEGDPDRSLRDLVKQAAAKMAEASGEVSDLIARTRMKVSDKK